MVDLSGSAPDNNNNNKHKELIIRLIQFTRAKNCQLSFVYLDSSFQRQSYRLLSVRVFGIPTNWPKVTELFQFQSLQLYDRELLVIVERPAFRVLVVQYFANKTFRDKELFALELTLRLIRLCESRLCILCYCYKIEMWLDLWIFALKN